MAKQLNVTITTLLEYISYQMISGSKKTIEQAGIPCLFYAQFE
jgi:hypothetical protein